LVWASRPGTKYEHLAGIFDSIEAATLDGSIWGFPRGATRTCTFITSKGYLGVAAGSIAVGDSLAILAGCKFPFCVRLALVNQARPAYELAAPAYVQGNATACR